jgi:hypothetical protein
VVNSPFEYRAEQKGFKVLLSIKETAEFVKIPINGLSTSQRKIDREPDELVRILRGAAQCEFVFGKPEREISAGFGGKLLKLDSLVAKRFYALYLPQSTALRSPLTRVLDPIRQSTTEAHGEDRRVYCNRLLSSQR